MHAHIHLERGAGVGGVEPKSNLSIMPIVVQTILYTHTHVRQHAQEK